MEDCLHNPVFSVAPNTDSSPTLMISCQVQLTHCQGVFEEVSGSGICRGDCWLKTSPLTKPRGKSWIGKISADNDENNFKFFYLSVCYFSFSSLLSFSPGCSASFCPVGGERVLAVMAACHPLLLASISH